MFRAALAVGFLLAAPCQLTLFAKPLGYERFTDLEVESGVFTELTPGEVFENYALQLILAGNFAHGVRDKRLIDIETHLDDNGDLKLSGIWIENKGEDKLDSWLVLNLRWGDLIALGEFWEEIIPLDMERYDNKKGQLRYAVIFQRNTHKSHWYFKPDMDYDQLWYDYPEYRWVDVDRYWNNKEKKYDAIMVENVGPNHVPTWWIENLGSDYTDWQFLFDYTFSVVNMNGIQAVDLIHNNEMIVVDSGRNFVLARWQNDLQADIHQAFHGRAIDIEGGPTAFPDLPFPNGDDYQNKNWATLYSGKLP